MRVNVRPTDSGPLLTPAEVAAMFRVDPKTVTRWAKSGKLSSIRTLGGHRRYRETEVRELLGGVPGQRGDDVRAAPARPRAAADAARRRAGGQPCPMPARKRVARRRMMG